MHQDKNIIQDKFSMPQNCVCYTVPRNIYYRLLVANISQNSFFPFPFIIRLIPFLYF
jgi:hypothetical protein